MVFWVQCAQYSIKRFVQWWHELQANSVYVYALASPTRAVMFGLLFHMIYYCIHRVFSICKLFNRGSTQAHVWCAGQGSQQNQQQLDFKRTVAIMKTCTHASALECVPVGISFVIRLSVDSWFESKFDFGVLCSSCALPLILDAYF